MTLQELIQSEIDAKTTKAKGSATDAMLWLKRALSFIREFLTAVTEGDRAAKGSVKVCFLRSTSEYCSGSMVYVEPSFVLLKSLNSVSTLASFRKQNAATGAYTLTLKKFHGMLVKGVFSLAMSAVPNWEGLIKALKRESDDTEEQIVEQIKGFVADFSAHLDIITKFMAENNLDPKP